MLTEVYTPIFTECYAKCGAQVEYKTTKRIYCAACRLERKRTSARKTMTKQRLANGIAPVKGVPVPCSVCCVSYLRCVIHSHRCKACQSNFNTLRTRAESHKKKTDPARRERYNNWFKNKRIEDPGFRVSTHFTTLIHRALGKNKAGRSWKTFVDYTLEELMAHLEGQFLPGMTWENKGAWHIDHIVPRSAFEYESPEDPAFKECWKLSNLQPLWALDNIRKNAKR